jgi:hypothetical protein
MKTGPRGAPFGCAARSVAQDDQSADGQSLLPAIPNSASSDWNTL